MRKFRDPFIIFGAVVCFVEFLTMDIVPSPEYQTLAGVLHLVASVVLMITLILYVSMWRLGWVLFLRIIFAGFITMMIVLSLKAGYGLLF